MNVARDFQMETNLEQAECKDDESKRSHVASGHDDCVAYKFSAVKQKQ